MLLAEPRHAMIGGRAFPYQFWNGERLHWHPEVPLSLDVETEVIDDERRIPQLALAVASDGGLHVVIHADKLGAFLIEHQDAPFCGHNVQFDFWAIDQHLSRRQESTARRVLWDACHAGRLRDTMILDMLIQLATGQYRKALRTTGHEAEAPKVYPGSLAEVAQDYLGLAIDKSDPYRLRFGELIGVADTDWPEIEQGFFDYAIGDAVVTHRLYPALADVAYRLMVEYGFDPAAERYEIRPDAMERFGYLSEIVQVKASIVLTRMFRQGVHIDTEQVEVLAQQYRSEMDALIERLRQEFPDVLSYNKDGSLRVTPKGQTPSLVDSKLLPTLQRVAEEIGASGQPFTLPQSRGKRGGISKSAKDWQKYVSRNSMIRMDILLTKA